MFSRVPIANKHVTHFINVAVVVHHYIPHNNNQQQQRFLRNVSIETKIFIQKGSKEEQ